METTEKSHKYGPPGTKSRTRLYNRHRDYCISKGEFVEWEDYRKAVAKKFGPPNKVDAIESYRHRVFCKKYGYMSYAKFVIESEAYTESRTMSQFSNKIHTEPQEPLPPAIKRSRKSLMEYAKRDRDFDRIDIDNRAPSELAQKIARICLRRNLLPANMEWMAKK